MTISGNLVRVLVEGKQSTSIADTLQRYGRPAQDERRLRQIEIMLMSQGFS